MTRRRHLRQGPTAKPYTGQLRDVDPDDYIKTIWIGPGGRREEWFTHPDWCSPSDTLSGEYVDGVTGEIRTAWDED